jgi:2-isopropylmalate synthase
VLGIEIQSQEQLDKLYQKFLEMADKKKQLNDEDLLVLTGASINTSEHLVKMESLQVTSGKGITPVAAIKLKIANEVFEAAATGNGPVDASIKALKQIIHRQMELKELTIQAISKGSDDLCKVHVQVEHEGTVYYGFGSNTDIVTATVEAYIDCINKFKVAKL